SQFGVFAAGAFNERDGAGEHDAIAANNAFDALGKRQATATAHPGGPDVLRRLDAGPNEKSFIPRRQSKTPFQNAFKISVSLRVSTSWDIPFAKPRYSIRRIAPLAADDASFVYRPRYPLVNLGAGLFQVFKRDAISFSLTCNCKTLPGMS